MYYYVYRYNTNAYIVRILSLDNRYILLSTQNKQKLDVNV